MIWGEEKVPSAAGGEAEHGPGALSVEGTENQPGKCWAEKERERLAGRRNLSCDLVLLVRDLCRVSQEAVTLSGIDLIEVNMCHYLRGKVGTHSWMQDSDAQFLARKI